MYKRQARIVQPISLTLSRLSQPLNIIIEEEESRASSSRSPSPSSPKSQYSSSSSSSSPLSSPTRSNSNSSTKARRRHANVSDIRIVKDLAHNSDSDLSPLDDMLLIPSRRAPSPPAHTQQTQSPVLGSASVSLTFTDVSYRFPLPPAASVYERTPECPSPALSASSLSECSSMSPRSHRGAMPLTPSTSDDEFALPSRTYNPRRAAIQPLVVVKHARDEHDEQGIVKSAFLHPLQNQAQKSSSRPTTPLSASSSRPNTPLSATSFLAYDSSESDSESDSEFYHKEFASFLTVRSPLPRIPHQAAARPESMAMGVEEVLAMGVLPAPRTTSSSPATSKRTSRRISIPKYPPPPPPSNKAASACPKILVQAPRPPPRSSIPADFSYEDDDASSAFSFSMYEIDFGDDDVAEARPVSAYSQPSQYSQPSRYSQLSQVDEEFTSQLDEEFSSQLEEFPAQDAETASQIDSEYPAEDLSVDELRFDMDMQLMLPLSLPNTPMDLEHDIAMGLEELRGGRVEKLRVVEEVVEEAVVKNVVEESYVVEEEEAHVVVEEPVEESYVVEEPVAQSEEQHETVYEQDFIQDIFTSPVSSPTPSSFSFGSYYSGSPCASPSPYHTSSQYHNNNTSPYHSSSQYHTSTSQYHNTSTNSPYHTPSPALKSKWSTSTLGSIREEHERRSAPSKLRLYFNSHSPIKGKRGSGVSEKGTPTKRGSQGQEKHQSKQQMPSTPSSPFYYNMMSPRKASRYGHARQDSSDVMMTGPGVRRRPSVNSVSDAGSEESSSSTSSSGLRRKPIPVEMFLRSAVGGQ